MNKIIISEGVSEANMDSDFLVVSAQSLIDTKVYTCSQIVTFLHLFKLCFKYFKLNFFKSTVMWYRGPRLGMACDASF